jgi:hypothetical protein
VLLSSHALSEVDRVPDRVAILRAGRLVVVEALEKLRAVALRRWDIEFEDPPSADRVRALPGVRAAGVVSTLPLGGGWDRVGPEIEGRPAGSYGAGTEVDRYIVSPGYFAAMGIDLREGRLLDERDGETRVRRRARDRDEVRRRHAAACAVTEHERSRRPARRRQVDARRAVRRLEELRGASRRAVSRRRTAPSRR